MVFVLEFGNGMSRYWLLFTEIVLTVTINRSAERCNNIILLTLTQNCNRAELGRGYCYIFSTA